MGNNNSSSSSGGGIGFFGLLTVVFITLKLLGITVVSTWSWIWVLSPIWLGFLFWVLVILILAFIAYITTSWY